MTARDWLGVGEATVSALEAIEEVAHVGGEHAESALAAVRAILHALKGGFSGAESPQSVLMAIEHLRDAVASNDSKVLAEVRERFKKK